MIRRDSGADDGVGYESVDTRDDSGPEGRIYTAAFAVVWDAVVTEIASHRGWDLVHADEDRGLFTVACHSRLRRTASDLSIWVRLDEFGLTRLDVRSDHRKGRIDAAAARRAVTDLLAAIDDALGPGTRIKKSSK